MWYLYYRLWKKQHVLIVSLLWWQWHWWRRRVAIREMLRILQARNFHSCSFLGHKLLQLQLVENSSYKLFWQYSAVVYNVIPRERKEGKNLIEWRAINNGIDVEEACDNKTRNVYSRRTPSVPETGCINCKNHLVRLPTRWQSDSDRSSRRVRRYSWQKRHSFISKYTAN